MGRIISSVERLHILCQFASPKKKETYSIRLRLYDLETWVERSPADDDKTSSQIKLAVSIPRVPRKSSRLVHRLCGVPSISSKCRMRASPAATEYRHLPPASSDELRALWKDIWVIARPPMALTRTHSPSFHVHGTGQSDGNPVHEIPPPPPTFSLVCLFCFLSLSVSFFLYFWNKWKQREELILHAFRQAMKLNIYPITRANDAVYLSRNTDM